jgi:hypothetical protein
VTDPVTVHALAVGAGLSTLLGAAWLAVRRQALAPSVLAGWLAAKPPAPAPAPPTLGPLHAPLRPPLPIEVPMTMPAVDPSTTTVTTDPGAAVSPPAAPADPLQAAFASLGEKISSYESKRTDATSAQAGALALQAQADAAKADAAQKAADADAALGAVKADYAALGAVLSPPAAPPPAAS